MNTINILGTGHYVPPNIVTNDDFAAILDTNDEWIRTRTGMERRHFSTSEPSWYLGYQAAAKALEAANTIPSEIDMVIVTTGTPGYNTPGIASLIAGKLEIPKAITVDVSMACTGLCFGMDMAHLYLQNSQINKILVVAAEEVTQYVDYTDRSSAILFGDGGSACVLHRAQGIYGSYFSGDPAGAKYIFSKQHRTAHPFGGSSDTTEYDPFTIEKAGELIMNGKEVYKFATKSMPEAVRLACQQAGIEVSQIDWMIPHQANRRIIETAAHNLDFPLEKVGINIQNYGNTSSASIGICLDEMVQNSIIRRGDIICLVGFGAGLTYGAVIFPY